MQFDGVWGCWWRRHRRKLFQVKLNKRLSGCFTVHLQQAIGGWRASEADRRSVWRGRQKAAVFWLYLAEQEDFVRPRHNKVNASRRWGSN